jgi:hypothetical protein
VSITLKIGVGVVLSLVVTPLIPGITNSSSVAIVSNALVAFANDIVNSVGTMAQAAISALMIRLVPRGSERAT